MACFTVPAGEAVVTTIVKKVIDKKEIKEGTSTPKNGIPFSRKLKWLTNLLWGASLMWFVDAIAEYIELGADYFAPAVEDMINDSFLGFSVIAFALIIWVVYLLIKDPKGVVRKSIS